MVCQINKNGSIQINRVSSHASPLFIAKIVKIELEIKHFNFRPGLSFRGGGRGFFPGYYERAPPLLSKKNIRQIEPKERVA